MLEKFGINIELADDGEAALQMLERLNYDLVLMDCQMPVMDGYEATRRIRDPQSRVKDRAVPVIAMTANAMLGDREHCIEVGMDDHIAKPVDPTKLRLILERWLPGRCQLESVQEKAGSARLAARNSAQEPGDRKENQAPAEPVFDHADMRQRLMGDDELMRNVAEAVLADMPQQIEWLKTQVLNGDVEQAFAQAHKIKGAVLNAGGKALGELALTMETAGKSGDLETMRREVPALEQGFLRLKTEMERVLF